MSAHSDTSGADPAGAEQAGAEKAGAEQAGAEQAETPPPRADMPSVSADRSVWLIWGGVMLLAVAALPFAVRSQDVVRAIATMCGFTIG